VVERIFVPLQILSACFVAFAHGANDVANAIGPIGAAIDVLKTGSVALEAPIPLWLLTLGGVGIVVGLATWGWRVIETIGKKITELTPTRGFAAQFGAATTVVIASKLGLPISTSHVLVGAVLGVGLARGIGAINLQIIRDIMVSWVITIPAGAVMAVLFFYVLRAIFG
jgi:phosphate/sulfate permease